MMFSKDTTLTCLSVASLLAASASDATAAIVANFTGGNGNGSVDAYVGTSGNGWTSAWGSPAASTNTSATVSASVVSTSPLNAGGNYLGATFTSATNSSNYKQSIRRSYDTFDGVSATTPHEIKFDYRLDTATSAFDAANDNIAIFGGTTTGFEINGNTTWGVRAFLGADSGSTPKLNWGFYSGNGTDSTSSGTSLTMSGISVAAGTVYSFTIDVDPVTRKYTASVSDGTNTYTTPTALNFRATSNESDVIHFAGQMSGASDSFSFSVDNISIAVPEPASLGLLGLAGALLGGRRRSMTR